GGRPDRGPFWRRAYAAGDPLPRIECAVSRPTYRFDEGDPLPDEYRSLLTKMLRHEGERAGNKSFLGFMGTCLDLAEALYPTREARLIKAEYLAEELKHAIMFHRLAVGLDRDFALRDVPYAHYTSHPPRWTCSGARMPGTRQSSFSGVSRAWTTPRSGGSTRATSTRSSARSV